MSAARDLVLARPLHAPPTLVGPTRLTVLLGLWRGWRPVYELSHVRAIARMLREYLHIPHRLVLLTDFAGVTAKEVEVDEVLGIPPEPKGLRTTGTVNCYRRLRFFDPAYARQFETPYIMSVDLDSLFLDDITRDITAAMKNPFGFTILRARHAEHPGERPYNGSLFVLRVGAHPHVWYDFDPVQSPIAVRASGWRGSDQVHVSLAVRGAPLFDPEHGFYFLDQYLQSTDTDCQAKMLNYAGPLKPWSKMAKHETPELYEQWRRFDQ